jgi:thiol:disulfide interchange protein
LDDVEMEMPGFVGQPLRVLILTACAVSALHFSPAFGQLAPINPLRKPEDSSKTKPAIVTASAEFDRPDASNKSVLSVTAKIAKGWHIYSVTQKKGGPIATKIKLDESPILKAAGEFKPTKPPEVHEYPKAWKDLKVEEHHGSVTWKGTIELAEGVDPAKVEILGAVYAQACADQCIAPKSYKFTARLASESSADPRAAADGVDADVIPAAYADADSKAAKNAARRDNVWPREKPALDDVKLVTDHQPLGDLQIQPLDAPSVAKPVQSAAQGTERYRNSSLEATITGRIQPATVVPGGEARVVLSIAPTPGWHFYAYADEPVSGQSKPTLIRLAKAGGFVVAPPIANAAPKLKPSPLPGGGMVSVFEKPVEWTISLRVPSDAAPGPRTIEGLVGLMTCNETTCLIPQGVRFTGELTVADRSASEAAPLTFVKASYSAVANATRQTSPTRSAETADAALPSGPAGDSETVTSAAGIPKFEPRNLASATSLPVILAFGLLGGLLLNLMPCVLPVIGLKILSFVEQGGRQRGHILVLNLWYSAGILSVFLVLATLAAFLNFGWGEQFQSTGFNVALAAIVFVMALSFLGIWEVPIPGFASSSTATKLSHREGFFGAFCKGVLTTVLATPCSAPFLGPVFGFTLRQPPHVIYLIFASVGLGLALPYLVIGAFPKLIRFLPKPGAWMDTFKQLMGFVLLGTVVFLFTFIDKDYLAPTFALLAVLWAACWWINRTPLTADAGRRLLAWGQAVLFAGVVGYFSFNLVLPGPSVLRWEPFSVAAWNKHTSEGKTVLVEFTADWCLNCKLNMEWAIDTDVVRRVAEQNDVVPLLADYSEMSDEIKNMIEALGSRSIPLLAVFPAGDPTRPIVLPDMLTKGQVVEALRQAGPSKKADSSSVAMRSERWEQ